MILLCVVVAPASSGGASVAGAVGRIVFTSDRDGSSSSEIYSAAADGTDVKRLTWSEGYEQGPAWSPDGSRIAYERSYQGRFRVFAMNQDGSDQRLVSPDVVSSTVDDVQPAWSPDGTQIAFASTRPFGSAWHVWVMDADGTNLRQLPGSLTQHPAWSPDGSRLAGDDGNGPLYVINSDGTNQQRLTAPASLHYDESPDWSPDGSSLVFSERSFDGTQSALYRVGADGSGLHQLTSGAADYRPSWSPAGTAVVFDRHTTASGSSQLFVVGSDGGATSQLLTSARNDMEPRWGTSTVSPVVTPPTAPDIDIQVYNPVNGGIYFPSSTEPVLFLCNPGAPTTVIVSCIGSQPLFESLDTSFAGTHQFTVTATDIGGRQATATVSYTVLDFTAPTIELRTPASAGDYDLGSTVTVDYGCSDGRGGSGVRFCSGTLPNGAPLDTSHPGTFTFEVATLDNANNFARTSVTYRIVDRRPPAVTISSPTQGAVYQQDQIVASDYACSDGPNGSGITSCEGSVSDGAAIDTSAIGEHTFTVTASKAGHLTTTSSHSYTVIYNFTGFFSPIAAFPTTNRVKAGEAVPMKFSLGGYRGPDILSSSSPSWTPCDAATAGSTPAAGTLSYNTSLSRYTFLANTDRSWAGSCKDLTATLRDGTTHRARFTFAR
jgi:Tol biopolymer transport system component